jgi:hypothetical protein
MARGCLAAVGAGIALVSAFFVAAALVESAAGGDGKTSPGVYAGLIAFFGGTFVAGAYLVWRMLRNRAATSVTDGPADGAPTPSTEADRERQVLQHAESERGRVTIPEVAARCNMTIADAKATLDRLVSQEAATMQVTEDGVIVYVFAGFLSDEDKARAGDF